MLARVREIVCGWFDGPSPELSDKGASFDEEIRELDVGVGERGNLVCGIDFSDTALGGRGSWGDGSF